MASQGIESTRITRKVRIGTRTESKAAAPNKGIVSVPPHVRIVHGKPVYVAGYSYRR